MSEVVLFSKLRELEDELRLERDLRFRLEKDLMNLKVDLDVSQANYQDLLNEKEREADFNKRLKQDYHDIKSKFDNLFFEQEESTTIFKRRNIEQVSELTAHVESLSKSKSKYEKDNKQFLLEIEQLRLENDSLSRAKSQAVALAKELEAKETEHLRRIDEVLRQLTDSNETKNKLSQENASLVIKIERIEFELNQLNLTYKRVVQELDDAKLHLENEIIFRSNIENKYKTAQFDLTSVNAQLDHTIQERDEFEKQVARSHDETRLLRERFDKDLEAKNEEIEDIRRKFNAKIIDIQEELNITIVKLNNTEKTRQKLQSQVDILITDLDREKKRSEEAIRLQKQYEREVDDLKNKLSAVNGELDAALQANRNYQVELQKARALSEQLSEQIELLTKEKRRLLDELDQTNHQLTDAHNRILDYERRIKIIEAEKLELSGELEDTRDSLQVEITKYTNISIQYEQYKISMEKRLLDKDDEIDELRKSHRIQVEQLQQSIEDLEVRYKNEIISIRKKYQIDLEELRLRYDALKKQYTESENSLKSLHIRYSDLNDKFVEEQHLHDATREQLSAAEKRAATARGELEELKILFDRSEKLRKTIEIEFHDIEVKYQDSIAAYNRAIAERKKYEADYLETFETLQEVRLALKSSEDRARSATAALVKKDEEIRHERELALEIDAARKSLEQQLREAQARVEEAEDYARKEAKRLASKYEARISQLEGDVELERQKSQDYIKEIRRLEKRSKDLAIQVEEEQTRVISLTESHEKLQEKMKKYRSQIEGAEGQVAVNISRCRRLQRELDDAEERAETMTKNFLRSTSVVRSGDHEGRESSYIEDYSTAVQSSSAHNTPASYLRPSYILSRASHIDDYQPSYSRAGSTYSYRLRYRTVDLDESDLPKSSAVKHTHNTSSYTSSSASHQQQNNNYDTTYLRSRAQSRSRMSTKLKRTLRGLSV